MTAGKRDVTPAPDPPMAEQLKTWFDSHQPATNALSGSVVVMVHGIRTSGRWIRRIKSILEAEAACVVEVAGFGFFDVFRFLLPGRTRKAVIATVKWKLLHAIDRHKHRPLIIVAHSFGTFCITEILKDTPQIRPSRLLLCGSIVAQDFRWDALSQMAPERGMRVVNECGVRDIWPPLAHSVTFGYGSSGTGGFQVPGVEDRCHDVGHSGYFTKEFVREFWVPFIRDGTIAHSKFEEEMPEARWWISVIGLRPLLPWSLWVLGAVLAYSIFIGVGMLPTKTTTEVATPDLSDGAAWRMSPAPRTPGERSAQNANAPTSPLALIHYLKTNDSEGFPLLQITLRNNEHRAQVITSVRIDCRFERRFGGGGGYRTRPLLPLTCWDIDLSQIECREARSIQLRKPFEFNPPQPVLIDADDAAVINIRIHGGILRPWPAIGGPIMPTVDEKSDPDNPQIPTPGYSIQLTFVSDRGRRTTSEWLQVP